MKLLTECGDASLKLCNPCDNPDFLYLSAKSNLCYKTKELANAGEGACGTWCTND